MAVDMLLESHTSDLEVTIVPSFEMKSGSFNRQKVKSRAFDMRG
jgi:hypothetical protein